jgi:hypothetical protein
MRNDNDQEQGKDQPGSSTARATAAAIPSQTGDQLDGGEYPQDSQPIERTNIADLPTLGEQDGTFYFLKHLTGQDEVPEQTHQDNFVELCRMALNNSWRPNDDTARVVQSERTDDGWNVLYGVDVELNEARG